MYPIPKSILRHVLKIKFFYLFKSSFLSTLFLISHSNFTCIKVDNASKIHIADLKIRGRVSLGSSRNAQAPNFALSFWLCSSGTFRRWFRIRYEECGGETRQRMKTTYVRTRRSRTIYAVLTVDAPAMHFYPAPRQLSCHEVGSIDIISGLCTTRAEFTMRFRVRAATHLP